jgi:type IV pilus assembly protein PilC
LGRFCEVFHGCLLAAMHISESVRAAGHACQSGRLASGARQAADEVLAGETLASSLKMTGDFPKAFTDSMDAAEQAGTLDAELQRWARSETDFAISSQRRAAEILPRAAYVLVMLYVAAGIIRFFMGYFGEITRLSSGIGGG